jgi:thiol:disulfide interchange protein DsbC
MFISKIISKKSVSQWFIASVLGVAAVSSFANEAAIRKNLAERFPSFPAIDEVIKTPISGIFEVRMNGTEIIYTDADANHVIQGSILDTIARANLTEERINKLTAVDFKILPLKDAFTIVRGNGKRKIAVFEDPNCGYCKRYEREMQKVENATFYMFLYPILGADSVTKSNHLWCAKDKAKAWQDWMVRDQAIAPASCDTSALTRNVEFGKKYKITGTPTMFFIDGTRVPGAIDAAQVEKLLASAK